MAAAKLVILVIHVVSYVLRILKMQLVLHTPHMES